MEAFKPDSQFIILGASGSFARFVLSVWKSMLKKRACGYHGKYVPDRYVMFKNATTSKIPGSGNRDLGLEILME